MNHLSSIFLQDIFAIFVNPVLEITKLLVCGNILQEAEDYKVVIIYVASLFASSDYIIKERTLGKGKYVYQ